MIIITVMTTIIDYSGSQSTVPSPPLGFSHCRSGARRRF